MDIKQHGGGDDQQRGSGDGRGCGSTTIQATLGSINGSTSLTVTPPSLSVAGGDAGGSSIVNGATEQFTATGTYSDGSQQNLSSSATWTSSNTAVATISSAGLATAVATGSTTIQATSGSISGSTTLTVTATMQGLVGWWKFDDGAGGTAADSSGNGYNATLVNGVSWVTGKIGDAVSANGGNRNVKINRRSMSARPRRLR